LYTLILSSDNTFKVLIDNSEVTSGKIEEYFDILPPKEIDDPSAKKPEDWVDNPTVPDVNDVKPDGWDDVPEFVTDDSATKPEDWNDETDGEWKAPRRRNPEFKGEWRQKTIPNPDYKGPWVAPKIANPDYKENNDLYKIGSAGGVGIEIWQVTAGSIFDNIWIGDSAEEAKEFAKKTFAERKEKEAEVKSKLDAEEAAKREAEREPEEDEDLSEYENIEGREDL
jgi:calreticulin